MISKRQVYQIAGELLQRTLSRMGRLPLLSELVAELESRLPEGPGAPSALPVSIPEEGDLPTERIRESYRNLLWDMQVLQDEYNHQVIVAGERVGAIRNRLLSLTQRLGRFAKKLDSLRSRVAESAWVYYDNVDDPSMVSWQETDATVDLLNGVAYCRHSVRTQIELSPGNARQTERGLAWLLDSSVRANALFLEIDAPVRLELWGGSSGNRTWKQLASGSVNGSGLIQFPMEEIDTVELRGVEGNISPFQVRRAALASVGYARSSTYRTKKIAMDPSVWKKPNLQGVILAKAEGDAPGGCALEPRLIVWQSENAWLRSPGRDRHYLSMSEKVVEPDASKIRKLDSGLVAVRFPDVSLDANTRLSVGENQYLFRLVQQSPAVGDGGDQQIPPPVESEMESAGFKPCSCEEVSVYPHSGRYGLYPTRTVYRQSPLVQFTWDGIIWTGCIVGVRRSADIANPASNAGLPGIPERSDLLLRSWFHVRERSSARLHVLVLAGSGFSVPASFTVWWNSRRLYQLHSGAAGDIRHEVGVDAPDEWNLLEIAVRHGRPDPSFSGVMLVAWYVEGSDRNSVLPDYAEMSTPHRLLLEPAGDVPRIWAPLRSADGFDVLLSHLPGGEVVGPYQSDPLNLKLVCSSLQDIPRYVQAEITIRSSGDSTARLDSVRIEVL